MKRTIGLILAGAALAVWAAAPAAAQSSVRVTLLEMEPFFYASLSHHGPYSDIPDVVARLLQSLQEQTIAPTGPIMIIFHEAPESAPNSDLRWEAGIPVSEVASLTYHEADESDEPATDVPLTIKEWPFTRIATAVHSGSYESTEETVDAMLEWIEANGYEPAGFFVERYTDADEAGNPHALRIEIWIPLKNAE